MNVIDEVIMKELQEQIFKRPGIIKPWVRKALLFISGFIIGFVVVWLVIHL